MNYYFFLIIKYIYRQGKIALLQKNNEIVYAINKNYQKQESNSNLFIDDIWKLLTSYKAGGYRKFLSISLF